MYQLLAWAGLCGGVGVAMMLSTREAIRAFGGMTLAWAVVNALIALFALRGVRHKARQSADAETMRGWARQLYRLLWINFGLDILYIAVGVALARWDVANRMLVGFGWAVVVQGAFLLLFDGWHGWRVRRRFLASG